VRGTELLGATTKVRVRARVRVRVRG